MKMEVIHLRGNVIVRKAGRTLGLTSTLPGSVLVEVN